MIPKFLIPILLIIVAVILRLQQKKKKMLCWFSSWHQLSKYLKLDHCEILGFSQMQINCEKKKPITIFFFFPILWRTIIQVQKDVTKKSRVMLVLPQLITLLVTCIQALHRILLLFTFILIIQGCAWATSAVDTAYNPHPNPSPLSLCCKKCWFDLYQRPFLIVAPEVVSKGHMFDDV